MSSMPSTSSCRIVFLDSRPLNPGDLSWAPLEQLGHFVAYDKTEEADIIARAADADIILLNKTPLSRHTLIQLPKLRLIGVAATGYDVVDVKAARELGIPVCNCAAYGTMAVAQMTVAHLLNVCNKVGHYAEAVKAGFWCQSPDFCCWDQPLFELEGKRLAIVGAGHIGLQVLALLRTFGMQLFAVTSRPAGDLPADVRKLTLEEAFATCDVVSLHQPLTESNRNMVCAALLAKAKPGLILINTARGRLVNEYDLAQALHEGRIGAYCTDVLADEPPSPDCPLLSSPNTFITPHVAWASQQARQRIMDMLCQHIRHFQQGHPTGVVNP